jgi:3-methyladenine DNA glycosylase AlkD
LRKAAKDFQNIAAEDVITLLESAIHEERLLALLIMVLKYSKGIETTKTDIYLLYLKNTKYINNWDLVDVSAHHIVGAYLMKKTKPLSTDWQNPTICGNDGLPFWRPFILSNTENMRTL